MHKFRVRLTVIFMLLIGSSVLLAGIIMAKLLENSYKEALVINMERESHLIIAMMDWNRSGSTEELTRYYSETARSLKKSADARVTIIRSDGTVIGESDEDPGHMNNHLDRTEVREAEAKGVGSSVRFSSTLGHNMLYVAVPIRKGENETFGYLRLATDLMDVEKAVRKLWMFLLAGLGILFVVAGIISYRIAFGLTRPFEKMTRVARQISNMNYQSRVTIRTKDEIGELGEAINTMADSLQLQVNRIKENEGRLKSVLENLMSGVLMIDREERIALLNRSAEEILGFTQEELLGRKYNEAKQPFEFTQLIGECIQTKEPIRDEMIFYFPEERILEVNLNPMFQSQEEWAGILIVLHDITAVRRLERMRSEFVANVSHELKTPIAAVKGFAETLLAGALNDTETARSFLQIIFDESERLNRLIGDILALSKIESKRIPLHFSPVHVKSFMENTVNVMRAEAAKKRIDLELQAEDDLYMEADEDRLRQIMINLLSNGIAYTPEGGKVKVRIYAADGGEGQDPETIRFIISDTGIGIPKKDLPRIFERFYRVDKARSRSSGGTGLGLSIVKHLVDLHKGHIAVESQIGAGTTFILDLPVLH
ncbi:two-component system histidine kinase PnpS [Gorillibacterium sp. sgz5001074]|uniref:two-component system histidine kinase PnpS n=1 Tax=Gorillibacterium sp. sgz5001074 TaxID=3446695 RepID=UPI003F66AEA4